MRAFIVAVAIAMSAMSTGPISGSHAAEIKVIDEDIDRYLSHGC